MGCLFPVYFPISLNNSNYMSNDALKKFTVKEPNFFLLPNVIPASTGCKLNETLLYLIKKSQLRRLIPLKF